MKNLLIQARRLKEDLLVEVDKGKLASDDIRMTHYNDIVTTAAGVMPGDPVLDRMAIMPDADLQGFQKWPWLQNVPLGDRLQRRLIAYLDRFIGRVELLLGDEVQHPAAAPAAKALMTLESDTEVTAIRGELRALRSAQSDPISIEARTFAFVTDPEVRSVLVQDFVEAQRSFASGANKASAILSAGVLEGMLLDVLRAPSVSIRSDYGDATQSFPRTADEVNWDRVGLRHLLGAAESLALLSSPASRLSAAAVDYRDTVHVRAEIRLRVRARLEESELLLALCKLVYRDLSEAAAVESEVRDGGA